MHIKTLPAYTALVNTSEQCGNEHTVLMCIANAHHCTRAHLLLQLFHILLQFLLLLDLALNPAGDAEPAWL